QASYANEAALGFYTQLLARLKPEAQLPIRLKLAEVLERVGKTGEALVAYEQALIQTPLADRAGRARICILIGDSYFRRADYVAAIENLERGWALAREAGEAHSAAWALSSLCFVRLRQGEVTTAEQLGKSALELAQTADDPAVLARVLRRLGSVNFDL